MKKFNEFKSWYNSYDGGIVLPSICFMFITLVVLIIYMIISFFINDIETYSTKIFLDNIFVQLNYFDSLYFHFEPSLYKDRWLNYIPIGIATISILSIIKTVLTGKCCILKGWELNTVFKFNFEIAIIFLIPYYLYISIISLIVFIIITIIIKAFDYIIDILINIKDKYNNICVENNKENIPNECNKKKIDFNKEIETEDDLKIKIYDSEDTYGKAERVSKSLDKQKLKDCVEDLYKRGYVCVYEGKTGYTFKLPL